MRKLSPGSGKGGDPMKFSIMIPFVPRLGEQALPFAGLVKWSSAARLWQGQGMLTEGHHVFCHIAGTGFRIPAGLGVSLMPLRSPLQAALEARSLAVLSGEPVVAGFGPGGLELQRRVLGRPYSSQLGACREYARLVRSLLDGQEVAGEGPYFPMSAQLPPFPAPRVDVGLGVLRPGMARLAGEVADAAITWLTPPSYLRDVVVPALREGSDAAGRPAPRLVAMVPVALAAADRDPVQLALASNRPHLAAPHYQDMLRTAGIDVQGTDPEHDAKELVAGQGFLYGDDDQLRAAAAEYAAAGVDELVINVSGVCSTYGPRAALHELTHLVGSLTAKDPS